MVDIFNNDAFSVTSLTNAINLLPNLYGKLNDMNLFPGKGVRTRNICVEEQNGVLNLLPTQAPGAPGTFESRPSRKLRSFAIPHIPHDDIIMPEEIQGVRAFGTENELQTVAGIVAEHLQSMRNKHVITLENLRMGALKGEITDADGSVIYNLYTAFGITKKTVNFALGTASTDVKKKCLEVVRHIEDNLKGEIMSEIHCLVSAEFFDALTSHSKVKEAYERWQDGAALRNDMRAGFPFGGIVFEEYRGQATLSDGTVKKFITEGAGHCFPVGTQQTFATYFAPADFNETVNTIGLPLYAKTASRKFERGVEIHTQSNPLPLCLRPSVLVEVTAS